MHRSLISQILRSRSQAGPNRRAASVVATATLALGLAVGDAASANAHINSVLSLRSVLAKHQPMIGVACRFSNRTDCGRIGVAIWLNRRASAATAKVSGSGMTLTAGGFGGQGPTYWQGYVRLTAKQLSLPAYWRGSPPRFLVVRFNIRFGARHAVGSLRLQLRPGWG
jgi:hypothetical protein